MVHHGGFTKPSAHAGMFIGVHSLRRSAALYSRLVPCRSPLRCEAPSTHATEPAATMTKTDKRLQHISQAIRVIPDFPKPGIMFQDVSPARTALLEVSWVQVGQCMQAQRGRGRSALRPGRDSPPAKVLLLCCRCAQVTTILLDPEAFRYAIDVFVERYKSMNIDVVAGAGRCGT